jgi:UDP-glucose-4-epimerase GalE
VHPIPPIPLCHPESGMVKILVTGGAGYIGSHVVRVLLSRGIDVAVVDDLTRGHRHNVEPRRLHVRSLSDTEFLVALMEKERFDAVIHFAAYAYVGESAEKPELYFRNNIAGTISLLDAMVRANLRRLVFSSTCAVYGEPAVVPISEDTPFAPLNPYGESKVAVEKMLGWLDRYRDLRSISLRYFNACGADPDGAHGEEHDPETHLIPLLLRAEAARPVTIFGDDYNTPDGTCIRDYIHVMDLAEAHVMAVQSLLDGGASNAFNVGTGRGYSVREVLRGVEQVTGRPVPHKIGPRRPGDAPILVAATAKIRKVLGWEPRYTEIREMVSTAWQFERELQNRLARPRSAN